MACSLDFVDSITASPTVRLALSAEPWTLRADDTEFSPPPLREAVAQTLLADGGVVPSSAYDFRRITLGLFLADDTADDLATGLQALHRELDRPGGNILRWWDHTTNPVFFRTFRASASQVRHVGRDGRKKRILVELRAEPFAYGLLETPVSGATVSTDPAAVSNGCFVDVTGVKGDVEAPALIRWPASAVAAGRVSLFAARRRGTPSQMPFLFQAEAMTQGTDTTTQANSASFSGAGNNYSRTTFATATLQTRLSLTDLGTASVDLRGRYRVFLRYRKNTATDDINIQLTWGTSSLQKTTNDVFVPPDTTDICFADLGEIQIPRGEDPTTNFRDGVEVAVSDVFFLAVLAGRTAGSGTLDSDLLLLVPADDRFSRLTWVEAVPDADRWWLDADTNWAHARNSSDRIVTSQPPEPRGGLPMLTPNQTNRLFMLYEVGEGKAHAIATTTTVSVAYFPRYLSVRPATT